MEQQDKDIEFLSVDAANFDDTVLGSTEPVLVDFSADWCQPCRAIAPVLDSLAMDYGDRLRLAVIDVDRNRELIDRFSVRSIPTVMLFAGGEIRRVLVGARPAQEYRDSIDALLH